MIKIFLFWTWCLPQTMLGWFVFMYCLIAGKIMRMHIYKSTAVIWTNHKAWGVSLGQFIFLGMNYNETTVKHEYGHTMQGFIFGPLYLLFVGLPSVTRNIISRITKKSSKWYYTGYPEKWADRLGGVKRTWQ